MILTLLRFPKQDPHQDPTQQTGGSGAGTQTQGGTATQQNNGGENTPGDGQDPLQSLDPETQQMFRPLIDAVDQRVTQSLEESERRTQAEVERMHGRLDEMRQPAQDGSVIWRQGAPGVRTGEDPMTSRGFSFVRAAAVVLGMDEVLPHAKTEQAVGRQLKQFYADRGFIAGSKKPFLVPLGASMLPSEVSDVQGEGIDGYTPEDIRQMMAQSLQGASPGGSRRVAQQAAGSGMSPRRVNQALSMFDDTGLGIFTEAGPRGEFIELVRANEVLSRAGARDLTLPPNGHLPFGSQTGAVTAKWIGEAKTIGTSEPTSGRKELRARKAAVLVDLPNELLRFGTPDVEAFLRSDMAAELALLSDKSGLEGLGTSVEPLGIINHANVVTHVASTTGTNGDTFEPEDPNLMLAEIEENDHDPDRDGFTWVMRGKMWRNILNRRSDAASADDSAGPWLFPVNRDDIARGAPSALVGHMVIRSGQVANDRSKGSSSDLTYILGGIFSNMIIGRVGVMEFAVSTENKFDTDETRLRGIEHVDYLLRHEDAFVFVDSVDMDLP